MHFKEPIIDLFQFLDQNFLEFGIDRWSERCLISSCYTRQSWRWYNSLHANCMDFSLMNFPLAFSCLSDKTYRLQTLVVKIVLLPFRFIANSQSELFSELNCGRLAYHRQLTVRLGTIPSSLSLRKWIPLSNESIGSMEGFRFGDETSMSTWACAWTMMINQSVF